MQAVWGDAVTVPLRPIGTRFWGPWLPDPAGNDSREHRTPWEVREHRLAARWPGDATGTLVEVVGAAETEYREPPQ